MHTQWPWLVPVHVLLYFTHMLQVSPLCRVMMMLVRIVMIMKQAFKWHMCD